MSEQRNAYGFPAEIKVATLMSDLGRYYGASVLGFRPQPTKLERAQAIAAEVRARRFPAVQRISTEKE